MKKSCLIFGALDSTDQKPIITDDTFVIAADGGLLSAIKLGIKPDLILGDFDSLGYIPDYKDVEVFPSKKDYTDSYIAITEGLKRDCDRFILFGTVGGRTDHTIANLQTLARLASIGKTAFAIGNSEIIFTIGSSPKFAQYDWESQSIDLKRSAPHHSVIVKTNKKTTISVFSLTEQCFGVEEIGTEYPLHDHTLTSFFPLGVSNTFEGQCRISVKEGILCVIIQKELFNPDDYIFE